MKANVGGVGIAMILLIAARLWLVRHGLLSHGLKLGVEFWGSFYIPIVVAMAAQQNVVAAVKRRSDRASSPAIGAVAVCFAMVALIGRLSGRVETHGRDRGARGRGARRRRRASHFKSEEDRHEHDDLTCLAANALLTAFAVVGVLMWISGRDLEIPHLRAHPRLGDRDHARPRARLCRRASSTGGEKGVADLPALAGIGLMGGAMLRDFAIVATAFEVDVVQARKAGLIGAVALGLGTVLPFIRRRARRRGVRLHRRGLDDDDRRRRGHLHRRPGHGRGDRRDPHR